MTTTLVRQHTRRKPSKRPEYIRMHEMLRSDVEAMRRGELRDRPVSSIAQVFRSLARAIGMEAR
jgi:hypothetical protein